MVLTPPTPRPPPAAPTLGTTLLRVLLVLAGMLPVATTAGTARRLELFDGHNLQGWYSWLVDTHRQDPRHVFSVTNRLLRISGDGLGYLATTNEFEDFRLVVEWRWGTLNTHWGDRIGRARDSGIFLHATGPDGNSHDGNGAFMAAVECNLFQGACGDLLLIRGTHADGSLIAPRLTARVSPIRDPEGWFTWHPRGRLQTIERWGRLNWRRKSNPWRDITDFRGPHDPERPPGQWNRTVCHLRRGHLRVYLNGHLVNEATNIHPPRGRILLQCEGSEIHFRRVTLFQTQTPH